MTLIDPPAFLGLTGNTYPAARFRRVYQLLLGGREGVLGVGDMAVTQTGTPGLSVSVAAGSAVVNGDDATRQGCYVVDNDAAVTVGPVTTPHSTLPRIDRLILEVLDQEGTGAGGGGRGSDLPQFRIVAGTPSSSPTAPAEPATAITLALITVGAGASAILDASISDARTVFRVAPQWLTEDIADGAVTSAKIGTGEVERGNIALAAIDVHRLAADAVEGPRIKNDTISHFKLMSGSVTEPKVAASTFIPLTMLNGATSGGLSHRGCAAQRDVTSRVFLRGIATVGSNGTIANIPAGFRPAVGETFAVATIGGAITSCFVAPDGDVGVVALTGAVVSLSGISYELT